MKAKPKTTAAEDAPQERVGGRPSKYEPWMDEAIIKFSRRGKSLRWIGAEIGVPYDTLHAWGTEKNADGTGKKPTFSHTLKLAADWFARYHEDIADEVMVEQPGGPKLNTGLWKCKMVRFKEYQEPKEAPAASKGQTHITLFQSSPTQPKN